MKTVFVLTLVLLIGCTNYNEVNEVVDRINIRSASEVDPVPVAIQSFRVKVIALVPFERVLCCVKAPSAEAAQEIALTKLGDDDPTVEPFWSRAAEDIQYVVQIIP